jgi:hypothetical protein
MLESLRESLGPWSNRTLFIGYGAFGPSHFGRWPGWTVYSLHTAGRIDPDHLCWDGGSPSYYTHNWDASTDYRVHSPQIESMNWVFMLEAVQKERPEFWFEISIWDGDTGPKSKSKSKRDFYKKQGQEFTPARYAGFVQFGMWLLTPRVVREFRGSTETRDRQGVFFEALASGVDRVYTNDVLRRFWRKGRLVPNRARKHPYQSKIPEEYEKTDRWFLLDTDLDPPRPWKHTTEIPVFALARVMGEAGAREWLIYAHSPLKHRPGVSITIPEYRSVKADVSVGGSFIHVIEKEASVLPLTFGVDKAGL